MSSTQPQTHGAIAVGDIRNIWAIGRNYTEHAKEMGSAVPSASGEPLIFLKAGSSAVRDGGTFHLPQFTEDVHHEVELTLLFGEVGGQLEFTAFTLGIDLTAREVQTRLKNHGQPWTLAKSFKDSCLLGPWLPLKPGLDLQNLEFTLKINNETRQRGRTADMVHSISKQRQYVLERFPAVAGDLLMTGTPAGVGPVRRGDHLEAEIPGLLKATWTAAR